MSQGLKVYDQFGAEVYGTESFGAFLYETRTLAAGSSGTIAYPQLAGRWLIPILQPVGALSEMQNKTIYHMSSVDGNGGATPTVVYKYPDYGKYQWPSGDWLADNWPKGGSVLYLFVSG